MNKVSISVALCFLLLTAQAKAQVDDPFADFPLLLPELGSEFGPDERPSILDESVLHWSMEASDYHLIDPEKLLDVFKAHPEQFSLDFDADLKKIRRAAQLHDYSMSEAEYMLTLAKLMSPVLVIRLGNMLKYLNISVDEFNAYTEEKRNSEFCRYRVAIYRQNGIMYPQECWP